MDARELPERLRTTNPLDVDEFLLREAADEIERLRAVETAANGVLQAFSDYLATTYDDSPEPWNKVKNAIHALTLANTAGKLPDLEAGRE